MSSTHQTVFLIFKRCVEAIREGVLIRRANRRDKEFHFQNWFEDRLKESGEHYEIGGRNSFPDFRMVAFTEGYELKGLAYPGRVATFDSNSQLPTGFHNGRSIYYVFSRYPEKPDGDEYPVLDLVICHGDFLNADHDYVHKNRSVRGFGSYGDIFIRDRKMYVVPTPFRLAEGLAHHSTLILPASAEADPDFFEVGELSRTEAAELIVGYSFDLQTNEILPRQLPNPGIGTTHSFRAWRLNGTPSTPVRMSHPPSDEIEVDAMSDDESNE